MSRDEAPELGSSLQRASATLKDALGEACAADLDRIDTGELIRIEEVLAIATEAAKEAISVRRRLRTDQATPESPAEGERTDPVSREVTDKSGTRWTVFAVHPSGARGVIREHYREGWLTFDTTSETRRVAPIPPLWQTMSDEELLGLCEVAERARRRPSVQRGEHEQQA